MVCFALAILRFCKSYSELCPRTILNTSQAKIEATGDDLCRVWTVHSPGNYIATLRLNRFIVNNCNDVFFEIRNSETHYDACATTNKSKLLPLFRKYPIHIKLFATKKASLVLEFTSRNDTICPSNDFECTDKNRCFNYHQICDGKFDCDDHSDEICDFCPENSVACSVNTTSCFNPRTQRCNGYYDCPSGEDEFNCTTTCTNAIKCKTSAKCIHAHQLCNGIKDCDDGSDEDSCSSLACNQFFDFICDDGGCIGKELVGDGKDDCEDGSDEKNKHKAIQVILLFTLVILSCFATILVHRWCNSRRNVNQLIRNPPEFPLPPFRGPGEYSGYQLQFSECDYRHGGEIYEAFIQSRRENRYGRRRIHRRMNNCIHNVTPRSSIMAINNSTVAALASLGIPSEFCVGLDNTRKEGEPDSRASTEETDSLRCISSNWGRSTNEDVRVVNEV